MTGRPKGKGRMAGMWNDRPTREGQLRDWQDQAEPLSEGAAAAAREAHADGGNGKTHPARGAADFLAQTIESEIIPRLMLAHRVSLSESNASAPSPAPDTDEVTAFAVYVLQNDASAVLHEIKRRQDQGRPLDQLFLNLLAPSARHLGDLWSNDIISFSEVTVGLCTLHRVVRDLSSEFIYDSSNQNYVGRALLAPTVGEQHTMGLIMVAEFMRRAGWEVWEEPGADKDVVLDLVAGEWYDVVGFSASHDDSVEGLAALITATRRASKNRHLGILVGGRIFNERPALATRVGADAMAADARQAAMKAQALQQALSPSR